MTPWEAAGLGAVQGLTEFLPVSSTAHLLAARAALGHARPEDAFTTVVQLGTLAAVVAYFWRDVLAIFLAVQRDVARGDPFASAESRLAWKIAAASVPAGVAGLLLKGWLNRHFKTPEMMGKVAIVFALLMLASEWWLARRQRRGAPDVAEPGWGVALWVGLWQMLALMPGASRSGCTLTGAFFAGMARPAAARFSFLLSLPTVLAAGLKEFWDERREVLAPGGDGQNYLIGLAVSAAVGWLSIWALLAYLRRFGTGAFVAYRLLFGAGLIWWAGAR